MIPRQKYIPQEHIFNDIQKIYTNVHHDNRVHVYKG